MSVLQPLTRLQRIFSGRASKYLWKDIKKVKHERTHWAIYSLACSCQDLESQVRALESRIAKLEDGLM